MVASNKFRPDVDVVDNEATRGMVRQIRFLVTVEELPAGGSQEKA